MSFRMAGSNEKTSDSSSNSGKDSKSGPSYPRRYQFKPPESIAEESSASLRKSDGIKVGALKRSQSHLTIESQQKRIDPSQFASQNPWINGPIVLPASGVYPRGLHKSVSAASLATMKRLLGREKSPLPSIPYEQVESNERFVNSRPLIKDPPLPLKYPDFSSSFTPTEIVMQQQRRHPRIALVTKPDSPLSIGGGLLYGDVTVTVVNNKDSIPSPPLGIGYLSVDLVGVEFCNKRHNVFQSLAVDLINHDRPPPPGSTPSIRASADGYWDLVPAIFVLPFHLQLPENPGPPPYKSRHGNIRYILSATAIIRNGQDEAIVRDSCEIVVLGLHSPRVSLVNLTQPLTATEIFVLSRGLPFQDLTLRASLCRDVWASGMSLFVDIHIRNRTLKSVVKMTLSLERVMMVYYHSIAQLDHGFRRQSRLPDKIHRKTVASQVTSKSNIGWRGVAPLARESRTWMLDLPSGLATINTGRYFGVRYFLKVSLNLAYTAKTFEAQLPITVLDPNSLDMTSEFESPLMASSRPRPSTLTSDLARTSLRETHGRKLENKTPKQAQRQRRETWAWVTELSPHPSLVPSPLLPAYGIPSRTGKTPSRLRVENKAAESALPNLPERLRPPLDEYSSHAANRGYRVQPSDYPMSSTNMTGSSGSASQDPQPQNRDIGSTIASLSNHVQRPRHVVAGNQSLRPLRSEHDQAGSESIGQKLDKSFTTDVEHLDIKPRQSPRGLRVVVEDDPPSEVKQSPVRMRKLMHHRRAISRSKDVQAIYRPLSKTEDRQPIARSDDRHSHDNGWETVENFF